MKIKFLFILLVVFQYKAIAQNIPEQLSFPDTLWSSSDTFYVSGFNGSFVTTTSDTINLGTNGFVGESFKIWTEHDTVTIPYVNAPYKQRIYIPVASIKDTTICRLAFYEQSSNFSASYVKQNWGKASFSIPETYELSNIILYLSDCSSLTYNHPQNTDYINRIEKNFNSFKEHPLIKILNTKCSDGNHWNTYYGFRENSICFEFDDNNLLQYITPYKHVKYDNSELAGGEFRNILYLIQDFCTISEFRNFYKQNAEYYIQLEKRQSDLQPIHEMWEWIEKEFPQKYNSYKVIFSPLIKGSHSTQKFIKGDYLNPEYQECIMFVNSSSVVDSNKAYSEELKEGLLSGIVFTEIDHNYVNPSSRENINQIKDLIINKDYWATKEAQQNYSSEYAIFNEYMTHSLYCLYVREKYNNEVQEEIIKKRIALMELRGFTKFEQFNALLIDLMYKSAKTIYDSYAEIVNEMKKIR